MARQQVAARNENEDRRGDRAVKSYPAGKEREIEREVYTMLSTEACRCIVTTMPSCGLGWDETMG